MNFWDKIARFYDLAQKFNSKAYREMTAEITRLVSLGAQVLDCAAGTGTLTIAAAEKAEKVVCTDLSLSMLEQAKKKCSKNHINNVFFEERDITALSDLDESYDVVIAGNVLHLLDCPEKAVAELYRVTRTGGILILPTFLTLKKESPLVRVYRLLGFNPSKSYSPDEYRKMLEGCNIGEVKFKLIKGKIPCGFAVIRKDKIL